MDTYHFTGKAGQHILFNAINRSGNLDTAISLYAPSNLKETDTYDVWGGGGNKLDWTLKESGEYTLIVSDNDYKDSGAYKFSFLLLPDGPFTHYEDPELTYKNDPDGGTIVSGETKYGILYPSDMDGWQFTAQKGERILFTAVSNISWAVDTVISLYAPSGAREANTYDANGNGGDKLDWTLKETGKYTLIVEDNDYYGYTDYYASFLLLPDGPLTFAGDPHGGTIVSGETKYGILNPSDMDGWQFTAQKGERILFTAADSIREPSNLDTVISLYAPSGKREANTYGASGNGGDKLDWTLKETGKYTLVIEDNDYKDSGAYYASFLKLPGGPFISLSYPDDHRQRHHRHGPNQGSQYLSLL